MDPLYLVRLAGIEPTTPWFVAKYSIQLSYSRERKNYSMSRIHFGSLVCRFLFNLFNKSIFSYSGATIRGLPRLF